MTDIVERLRAGDWSHAEAISAMHEAAAEIERLRALNLRLVNGLTGIRAAADGLLALAGDKALPGPPA